MNMASQSQQSVSQHWGNIPPEILGLILSNLGKHDLLNVRMVSHAWNDESLAVLRKSKFTQMLRNWNMKNYLVFITPSKPRKFIIPFHLNFKAVAVGLKSLTSYVDTLCKIFGPECVSELTLTADYIYKAENILGVGLTELIGFISPGLKTLNLTRFNLRIYKQNQIIQLPNLKKLICSTSQSLPRNIGQDLANISIIENSPKLEDLTLTNSCDLEPWPLKFNQLKSLSLYILTKPQKLLDKILGSSGPPVLRELSLVQDFTVSPEDKLVVYNILQSLSTTLKSLKFRVPTHLLSCGNLGTMSFPKLPHLEHLGLEYNNGHRCWLNPGDNFSEETFPSLKSIELPIGFTFAQSSFQSEEDDDVTIEFPNLNKLILRVYSGSEDKKGTLKHLQKVFPTVSKLSLVDVGGDTCVKHILKRIMKSNWSKNIQELGMIGFSENYLGEFFDDMEFHPRVVLEKCDGILGDAIRKEFRKTMRKMRMKCVETIASPGVSILTRANESGSIKITNLTTVKIELMDGSNADNLYTPHYSLTIPNLTCLGEHFPQLRMIEISGLWFGQKNMDIWRRHILEFRSKFPGVFVSGP